MDLSRFRDAVYGCIEVESSGSKMDGIVVPWWSPVYEWKFLRMGQQKCCEVAGVTYGG